MSKKTSKQISKKEDSEDEYTIEDDPEIEDIEDMDEDEYMDEDIEEEEKEDHQIDPDDGVTECIIDDEIDDNENYFNNNHDADISIKKNSEYISKENRISANRLTKYEMVRILGERTKQLTMGAKIMIKNHQGLSYDRIAEEEFKKSMIPFKIKRPLPNGKFEIWTLDELSKDHLLYLLE